MLPERLKQNFVNFHNSMVANGILDAKTTVMIQLGAAMALGCYPCMTILTRVADEKGVTEDEIGAVQGIVMAVSAGTVFNQYREISERLEKE